MAVSEQTGPSESAPDERTEGRDLYVDFLRAGSLLVVVVWHWVFNLVYRDDTLVSATNPIGTTRGMWLLTWVLQVMPVFVLTAVRLSRSRPQRTSLEAANSATMVRTTEGRM